MSQCIVEDDTVVNPFASHARRHIDKTLATGKLRQYCENRRQISYRMTDVAKASKMDPRVHVETSRPCHSCSRSRPRNLRRHLARRPKSDANSDTNLPWSWNRSSYEYCREEPHLRHSKSRFHSSTPTTHQSARRTSRLSQRKLHGKSYQKVLNPVSIRFTDALSCYSMA